LMPTATPGTYVATCQQPANNVTVGTPNISALFGGDSVYDQGSGSLSETVIPAPTTTVITSPAPGSSTIYGNEGQNSLNVTVSAPGVFDNSPSGSVNIYDGVPGPDTYLCTGYLGGGGPGQSNANCYINNGQMNAGPYSLTAIYGGDNNFAGSTSSPDDISITQVTSQMQVFPVPGYAIYGAENGNFFITGVGGGNGGNPTGYFSITADGVNLIVPGSCSAGNGGGNPCFLSSATALPASATPYEVTVTYPGDVNFTPVSATAPLSVFAASSTTTLSISSQSAAFGTEGAVQLSATVTAGTTGSPTGSIAVKNGGTTICTIALAASSPDASTGSCTIGNSSLSLGAHSLTADYLGDGNYQSSISAVQPLNITNQPNHGYWLVGADGGLFAFGSSQFYGSTGSLRLQGPVVGITPTSDRQGYWLVGSDGGVFSFGDAGFHGSIPGLGLAPAGTLGSAHKLSAPIVGIVPTSDGAGYFMVSADGGVFAFGDAHFEGSCPGIGGCQGSAVSVIPDASGLGYWVVTSTGNVYAFGDAPYFGAPGVQESPITSAARTPDGGGYWILLADGTVHNYGDAEYLGDANGLGGLNPATAIYATADGGGYWLASARGAVDAFGDAPNEGGMASAHLNAPIIAATGW
jgi:Bacterial Ig-like domain (group 3)